MNEIETKIPDAGGDISTGISEAEFGFLRWRFFLRKEAVFATLERAQELNDPEYPKRLVLDFWMAGDRRPTSTSEVVELRILPHDRTRVRLEALVRRGHWLVADFLRDHPLAIVSRNDRGVSLYCDCHDEAPRTLPIYSFPPKDR